MSTAVEQRPITDLSREELTAWCAAQGESAYRADQIRRWIFSKRVNAFSEMHDVPAQLRTALEEQFTLFASQVVRHQVATDRTEKLLLELHDGEQIECVLMREPKRKTVCISSQVGCAMGCVFCASGLLGVRRNLTQGEMLDQILRIDRVLDTDERITHVVVMGIGEPLANLDNVLPAMITLNEKGAMGLGGRRITISTVGLPAKIIELAECGKPFNLAVSLHAPNDELRTQIVPVNENIGIAAILEATNIYFEKTGRRVTYEYVLLGGVNDADEQARELAALLQGHNAHVNLIPMNPVQVLQYKEPREPRAARFREILSAAGINVTIRKRKGADIDAACGQLRLEELQVDSSVK